jgi:hypothetical protein
VDFDSSVTILLGRGAGEMEPLEPGEWKRVKARVAWVKETMAALAEAQRHMDKRCLAAVERVPDEEFHRIFDEEQAKVSAILDQLHAVRDHDRWPAELYFGGV